MRSLRLIFYFMFSICLITSGTVNSFSKNSKIKSYCLEIEEFADESLQESQANDKTDDTQKPLHILGLKNLVQIDQDLPTGHTLKKKKLHLLHQVGQGPPFSFSA